MAMAAKEFTWGGELSKTKNEIEWNPVEEEDEEDEEMLLTHCLFLKQAMLGDDAKEGERNIIEVETRNWNNKKICQPFLSLKLGLNESCPLDLTLLPPVKLRLKRGTGPVYLMGTHAMEIEDDEDYFGDSSFDYETPERMKSKKRRGSANNSSVTNGSAKKRKVENGTDEDDEEDKNKDESSAEGEDDVDDNEDEEDEDDDEEEDGEEEGDEDEEEDEEDEDEEESMEDDEEEESPEKPKKKIPKGKQNGHSKEMMNGSAKKKGKKGKKNSLDEIKKEISQSSGTKHKKEEKFTNMVRSKYHMTDAKKLQDLWSWYKSAQLAK